MWGKLQYSGNMFFHLFAPPQFKWEWWWPCSFRIHVTFLHILQHRSQLCSSNLLWQVHSWHNVNKPCAQFFTECEKEWKIQSRELEGYGQQFDGFFCNAYFPLPFCNPSVSLSISLAIAHYHIIVSLVRGLVSQMLQSAINCSVTHKKSISDITYCKLVMMWGFSRRLHSKPR